MRIYLIILEILFIYKTLGIHVYVNINMDYLPTNVSNLKIYPRNVNISKCSYLRIISGSIFLTLDKGLKSSTCETTQVTFHIFIYHSNITSALIKVLNQYLPSSDTISVIGRLGNVTVLDEQNQYVIFIKCKPNVPNCEYENLDQRNLLNGVNLAMYSACQGTNGEDSCLTDVEFLYELKDADSSQNYLGTRIKIKSTNMKPEYNISSCQNGGILEKDNFTRRLKCICPKTNAFVERGPRCEVLQQTLNQKQYLYNLPNTNNLIIEFSYIPVGIAEPINIFKIENPEKSMFMQYVLNNNHHEFKVADKNLRLTYMLREPHSWFDVYINVSKENTRFRINENETLVNLVNQIPMMLDTFPFIFDGDGQIEKHKICIKNLRINSRIVDLYTPNYESCLKFQCQNCNNNETCIYTPFSFFDKNKCICKAGFIKSEDDKSCFKDSNMTGQLSTNTTKSITIPQVPIFLARLSFRTLLNNGILISLSATPYMIIIKITDGLIWLSFFDMTHMKTREAVIPHYDVRNGEWHTIQVDLRDYYIEMTLDENLPYNSVRLILDTVSTSSPVIKTVLLGAFYSSDVSNQNLSTCYDTLTIFPNIFKSDLKEFNIVLNGSLAEGCDSGRNCSCGDNQQCIEKWQNNTCVCEANFIDIGGKCVPSRCNTNPCQNNGVCLYENNNIGYRCQCVHSYSGVNCEFGVVLAAIPWWIFLIIVLIILLIIIVIILLLCCRKKTKKSEKSPDINLVYENAVDYRNRAGEDDYKGPPINFKALKEASMINSRLSEDTMNGSTKNVDVLSKASDVSKLSLQDPRNIFQDIVNRKQYYDQNNTDLVLDQPLEYGFEGFDNDDDDSLSSFSSNDGYAKVFRNNVQL